MDFQPCLMTERLQLYALGWMKATSRDGAVPSAPVVLVAWIVNGHSTPAKNNYGIIGIDHIDPQPYEFSEMR